MASTASNTDSNLNNIANIPLLPWKFMKTSCLPDCHYQEVSRRPRHHSTSNIPFLKKLSEVKAACSPSLLRAAQWLTLIDPPDYPEGAFTKNFTTDEDEIMATRRATHAGSWYTDRGRELDGELEDWLKKAGPIEKPARAIIGPHAGYKYCGAVAGHAYNQIDPSNVTRVFILGPSHHYRLNGCAVSNCVKYETPLYDLQVDRAMSEELLATNEFEVMSRSVDEDEHSIEMHLPYVAKVMASRKDQFTVVPVLVGSINASTEAKYGRIFAKYLLDPQNLFIISSDFCHWGERFHYQHYDESKGQIYQSIQALDYDGMEIIEQLDHERFSAYLKKYQNTICGRHPIGVFLGAVNAIQSRGTNGLRMRFKFRNYDQSNHVNNFSQSSVSYAAGVFTMG